MSHQRVVIKSLDVPPLVTVGEDVLLSCNFALLGKEKLYTVNWWHGGNQFYTYKQNKKTPMSSYKFPGIDVDVRIDYRTLEGYTVHNSAGNIFLLQFWLKTQADILYLSIRIINITIQSRKSFLKNFLCQYI